MMRATPRSTQVAGEPVMGRWSTMARLPLPPRSPVRNTGQGNSAGSGGAQLGRKTIGGILNIERGFLLLLYPCRNCSPFIICSPIDCGGCRAEIHQSGAVLVPAGPHHLQAAQHHRARRDLFRLARHNRTHKVEFIEIFLFIS